VTKQVAELDATGTGGEDDKKDGGGSAELSAALGPLGRSALALVGGQPGTPREQAEQFLDKAGVIGSLRRPFLDPFDSVYRMGVHEIEHTLAKHWQNETLPLLSPLFSRFPFNQAAEREVAPEELEVLNQSSGAFFHDVRGFYAPALSEQSGTYRVRTGALGPLSLPKDMLPTINQMVRLSSALFDSTGKKRPLRFTVRSVPGSRASDFRAVQPAMDFLQVGKTSIYSFNQRTSADALQIEWWNQGAAVVGIESTSARSGRKHTETLEVADSAWSFYRLLQKSTLDSDGISTWHIASDDANQAQSIRFALEPDPWALFHIKLP
jgi:type VI protein secretion system component VasK